MSIYIIRKQINNYSMKRIYPLVALCILLSSCFAKNDVNTDKKTEITPIKIQNNNSGSATIKSNSWTASLSWNTISSGTWTKITDKDTDDTIKEIDKIIEDVANEK